MAYHQKSKACFPSPSHHLSLNIFSHPRNPLRRSRSPPKSLYFSKENPSQQATTWISELLQEAACDRHRSGYDDARFKQMKEACEGRGSVSWLRPDMGYPMPPLGPQYGAIMVERVKKGIRELVDSGKLGEDGVFMF